MTAEEGPLPRDGTSTPGGGPAGQKAHPLPPPSGAPLPPPLAGPLPPPAGAPPGVTPPPVPAEVSGPRWRVWIGVGIVLLLVLGGCGALATYGGVRAFRSMTAPVDVANDYLDAVRGGGDGGAFACPGAEPPSEALVWSQGQYLDNVNIEGRSFATVNGTLRRDDGFNSRVVVTLGRVNDDWCVQDVRF